VSGEGGDTSSGEVAGFLRAFIAAGAGALAVTKWKVRDDAIASVAGQLLRAAARKAGGSIDIVTTLCEIQRRAFRDAAQRKDGRVRDLQGLEHPDNVLGEDPRILAGLHACPLVVYL